MAEFGDIVKQILKRLDLATTETEGAKDSAKQ